MVDIMLPYVLRVKILNLFNLKNKLCAISKAVCIWLIFKLGFDLDDDFYWT
jgi:hypothetical protein